MNKTETVSVLGSQLTLSEHTLYLDFKRQEAMRQAVAENLEDDDSSRCLMRIGYVNLTAGIIDGTPPTFDDLLFRVPMAEFEAWSAAARELNPHWFPTAEIDPADPELDAAAKKKPKQKPGGSTPP